MLVALCLQHPSNCCSKAFLCYGGESEQKEKSIFPCGIPQPGKKLALWKYPIWREESEDSALISTTSHMPVVVPLGACQHGAKPWAGLRVRLLRLWSGNSFRESVRWQRGESQPSGSMDGL